MCVCVCVLKVLTGHVCVEWRGDLPGPVIRAAFPWHDVNTCARLIIWPDGRMVWPHNWTHAHRYGLDCHTSNIRRPLVGNKRVDHSDIVGTSSVGAAPSTSYFPVQHLASMDWARKTRRETFIFWIWCGLYQRFDGNHLQVAKYRFP